LEDCDGDEEGRGGKKIWGKRGGLRKKKRPGLFFESDLSANAQQPEETPVMRIFHVQHSKES